MEYDWHQMNECWELLFDLLMAERARFPAIAAEFDLSPTQVHVLRLLEPGTAVPMGRLAGGLGCDASNITGVVDRLEARGLVERRAGERDRRVKVRGAVERGERDLVLEVAEVGDVVPRPRLAWAGHARRRVVAPAQHQVGADERHRCDERDHRPAQRRHVAGSRPLRPIGTSANSAITDATRKAREKACVAALRTWSVSWWCRCS